MIRERKSEALTWGNGLYGKLPELNGGHNTVASMHHFIEIFDS